MQDFFPIPGLQGKDGPQLLATLTVHRGPGGPLAACSTSAAPPVPWQIAAAPLPIVSELDTGAVV